MKEEAKPKERPIPFSDPMVRAVLEDRKGQTRRTRGLDGVNTYPDHWSNPVSLGGGRYRFEHWTKGTMDQTCPYGVPGDRLWVRETWCQKYDGGKAVEGQALYRADGVEVYKDDGDGGIAIRKDGSEATAWRPSIFMPRWASRLLLEVVGVRVERLLSISDEDVFAEGIERAGWGARLHNGPADMPVEPKTAYFHLWDAINGKGAHEVNPWVWVIEFKRVSA